MGHEKAHPGGEQGRKAALDPATRVARAEKEPARSDDEKTPRQRVEGAREQELDHEPPEQIDAAGNRDDGSQAARCVVRARYVDRERLRPRGLALPKFILPRRGFTLVKCTRRVLPSSRHSGGEPPAHTRAHTRPPLGRARHVLHPPFASARARAPNVGPMLPSILSAACSSPRTGPRFTMATVVPRSTARRRKR